MTNEQAFSSSQKRYSTLQASHTPSSPSTTHVAAKETVGTPVDDSSGTRPGRPPRLLLTLLGDYWWSHDEQLPSAALVTLLADFGVSDAAARAAINRLARHGLLISAKQGRQTFYRLSERAIQVLHDGTQRIFSFGEDIRPWDGVWSLVAFSIPEEKRHLRYVLRDRLRWLGFAPLYDGLWVSPRASLDDAASQLAELSISVITMFHAQVADGTPPSGLPQKAWDLAALRTHYQRFIAYVQQLQARVNTGAISPEEALRMRTQMMDDWRAFPAMDPDLPVEILPPDWPRTRARQLFISLYNELGPLAQRRVQRIIANYAPDLAQYAIYHVGKPAR